MDVDKKEACLVRKRSNEKRKYQSLDSSEKVKKLESLKKNEVQQARSGIFFIKFP